MGGIWRFLQERMFQWGYNANDIALLFDAFDADGDMELGYEEFHQMLVEMGLGFKEYESYELFQYFDEDRSGCITEKEFTRIIFPKEFIHEEIVHAEAHAVETLVSEEEDVYRSRNQLRAISPEDDMPSSSKEST